MIRSEIVGRLSAKHGISGTQAELVVESVLSAIAFALRREERVEIRGLGTFSIRRYRGYRGRNPKTGGAIEVKPKKLAHFKPSKSVSKTINEARTRASSAEPPKVAPTVGSEPQQSVSANRG
jgi:integration host factor subunit beta